MAQFVGVRLNRTDNSPWGFRLQGGKDFGQPLLIQKVNGGSLAEKAGLQVGDALLRVNNIDVQDLRHKDAQDTIVRAGNSFEVQVQRGVSITWKPQVSPVGHMPTPGGGRSPQTVTKTSLAAKPSSTPIPSGHNISPKPFGPSAPQMNGGDSVKAIVNKQYNTPLSIYNEETIAETLSAQAEVLAGGVLGVNFMKNEKTYDSQKSEVFKMVQEVEKEPREAEPAPLSNTKYFSTTSHAVGGRATSPRPLTPIARKMGTPELPQDKPYMPPQSPLPGSPNCSMCGKQIVGVFVRIKEKNLHVECFKCATCGSSLKNVGYYSINNKLYCDIHAKLVARQNPPAPNMDPITVPPGGRVPAAAYTSPSVTTNLPSSFSSAAPHSPQPGTIAPMPFHTTNAPGPKPFGSVSAPAPPVSVPFNAPSAAPVSNISTPKPQTEMAQPIIWPPPSKTSEPKEPSSKLGEKVRIKEPEKSEPNIPLLNVEDVDALSEDKKKKMSICSEEVCRISDKKLEKSDVASIYECTEEANRPPSPIPDKDISISLVNEISKAQARTRCEEKREMMSKQIFEQQSLTESKTKKTTKEEAFTTTSTSLEVGSSVTKTIGGLRRSVSPEILDISSKPHEVRSLLPPASAVRPMTPLQVVVFPPEIPGLLASSPQPPAVTELVVSYAATPSSHIKENTMHKKITQEEIQKSKQKKSQLKEEIHQHSKEIKSHLKEEVHHSKEKKSHSKKEKKNKEEKVLEEKKKLCEKELQMKSVEEKLYTKSEVDRIVQEELQKAFKTSEKKEIKEEKEVVKVARITDLPAPIIESGEMASALTVAPDRPFTPVPFPKPLEIPSVVEKPAKPINMEPVPLPPFTKPYFPPTPPPPEQEKESDRVARAMRDVKCRSPMTEALTIAPDRSYSPLPTVTKIEPPAVKEKHAFIPIADTPKNKKPMSMLSALTIAPDVPFTLPGKTPIPGENKTDEIKTSIPSAFKPLNGSVSGVIPKTAPLNKDLPLPYIPHAKVDSKYGVDKSVVAEPGMKKEVIKGFESTSAVSDTTRYSRKSEFECKTSRTESKTKEKLQDAPRTVVPILSKPSSGLQNPSLLPYYQANIGEIPVRNRSISPAPHPIKAPSMTPTKMPSSRSPITVPRTTVRSSALQQRQEIQDKQSSYGKHSSYDKHLTSTYSQKSTLSSESKSSTKTVTNINKTKQVFKPSTPPRQLSPHWRGDYVRAVQNLSPITVRLPSPQPRPMKPTGETSQEAGAKILIKKSKRGQSPLVTYEPEEHHSSSSKLTTSKECSSSKGCSNVEECSSGKGCSNGDCCSSGNGCSNGKCCSGSDTDKKTENSGKAVSSSNIKSSVSTSHQQSQHQQHHQSYQSIQQAEEVYHNKQIEHTQQSHHKQKQLQSQTYFTASTDSSSKAYGRDNDAQYKDRSYYSTEPNSYTTRKSANSTANQSKIPKSYEPNSSAFSRDMCGVNPSSSGGHAGGGGIGSGMPGSGKSGTVAGSTAPRRGRGVLNTSVPPGGRIPLCGHCNTQIRGPFITALGKIWCPDHFVCVNAKCRRPLQDIGFVEEADGLYCEYCFEQYLAPTCDKCNAKIKGDCLNAIGKHFHPECFRCSYCEKMFGNNPFFLEDALPYCEADWNELFTTKCFSCGFPIEAGDRWVEALSNNYHSQCFNCTMCKKNLEGQSFYAKGGRPYCKNHAR